MPWCVGEGERRLRAAGYIVATVDGRVFRCWQCEKGELRLTRVLEADGSIKPAVFRCLVCEDEIPIYPDKGGVQPQLKGTMRGKGFSADEPGSGGGPSGDPGDGQWR